MTCCNRMPVAFKKARPSSYYAGDYFCVPPYEVLLNRSPELPGDIVAKSLSSQLIGGKALFTTKVRADAIDCGYPWFLETYVPAVSDITAVYVAGDIFSFALKRDFLEKTVDWREIPPNRQIWQAHTLPNALVRAIREYMQALRLDYGRLDFLLDDNDRYWFCEVNPNGQFAWLDLEREHGLLDAVLEVVSPHTTHIPLCNNHPLHHSNTVFRTRV